MRRRQRWPDRGEPWYSSERSHCPQELEQSWSWVFWWASGSGSEWGSDGAVRKATDRTSWVRPISTTKVGTSEILRYGNTANAESCWDRYSLVRAMWSPLRSCGDVAAHMDHPPLRRRDTAESPVLHYVLWVQSPSKNGYDAGGEPAVAIHRGGDVVEGAHGGSALGNSRSCGTHPRSLQAASPWSMRPR